MLRFVFPRAIVIHTSQVALRIFRNRSAAQADEIDGWYDPDRRVTGPKDFLMRQKITRVTPQMVAYAAIQVTEPFLRTSPHLSLATPLPLPHRPTSRYPR